MILLKPPQTSATFDMPSSQSVGHLARGGVLWSALLTIGRQVISTLVTVILARILLPSDYGLVGMVATLTALVAVFSDFGLSLVTIQRKELSRAQIDNLFWANVGVGFLLWGICALLASPLAAFYKQPRLFLITIVVGSTFAIGGFAVQPVALIQRQMKFKQLAGVQIGSILIAAIAAVFLAANGAGYWALVWQGVFAGSALVMLAFLATGYRPSAPSRAVNMRSLFHFGGFLTANGVLIYLARNMDNVLIGRVWGVTELGFYSRAYFLMMVPSLLVTSAFASALIPALSALQHDKERFGAAYRTALQLSALIGCPLAAGLGLIAPEAVRLLYGPRWTEVVPILAWLSFAAVFQPIYTTQGWLFVAAGKGRACLIAGVFYAFITVASFAVGINFGAVGVARAYSVVFVTLVAFPILYLAHRAANVDFGRSVAVVLPALAATSFMALCVYICADILSGKSVGWLFLMIAKMAIGIASYLAACIILLRPTINGGTVKIQGRHISITRNFFRSNA